MERAGVRSVVQEGDAVRVDGLAARHLVAADGLHSPLRRQLGLDRPVRGAPRYGLRRHFAVRPWSSHVEVHWAPTAEAYVTPVGPDRVGLAVLTDRPAPYADLLQRFPELRDRLTGHEASDVLGAGPLRQAASRRVAGRVLLVGDAAGYVDALTGEGVALAVRQAAAAVDAIVAGDPQRYEQEWRAITRRYRLLTGALLTASRVGPARRALVPGADRLPGVFAAVVNALAG
jgi:flavin-dependent dehydrogenase